MMRSNLVVLGQNFRTSTSLCYSLDPRLHAPDLPPCYATRPRCPKQPDMRSRPELPCSPPSHAPSYPRARWRITLRLSSLPPTLSVQPMCSNLVAVTRPELQYTFKKPPHSPHPHPTGPILTPTSPRCIVPSARWGPDHSVFNTLGPPGGETVTQIDPSHLRRLRTAQLPKHSCCPTPLPAPSLHYPNAHDPPWLPLAHSPFATLPPSSRRWSPNPLLAAQILSLSPASGDQPVVDLFADPEHRTTRPAPPANPWRVAWSAPGRLSLLMPPAHLAVHAVNKFLGENAAGVIALTDEAAR
jgi:hypothetical protein